MKPVMVRTLLPRPEKMVRSAPLPMKRPLPLALAIAWIAIPHGCGAEPESNPLFPGADPHAVCIEKRIYVFATGLHGEGRKFHVMTSADGHEWRRQGPVLDFKDIPWITADGRTEAFAWAPCLATRGGKSYFYFSVGPQKPGFPAHIGVATGDSPSGPFKDSGKPLLTGGKGFEAIDPMVFHDPKSSKWLLYAGGSAGSKLRVFELAPDMISFAREVPVKTPPEFTEGAFMHLHGNIYHLTYSHGRWRHADYSVHHATSPSPLGPWIHRGHILTSDERHKGPGHHSIVRHPSTGEWMIFYHRWENARGEGPYQGSRQIAVDRLVHLPDGGIQAVRMTD